MISKAEKQKILSDLADCVVMEASIDCCMTDCDNTKGGWYNDEEEAAEDFYNSGWRADGEGYAYCPSCYKKQKNKKQ